IVVALSLLPPLMSTRPSARSASPTQNIWWWVLTFTGSVTSPVLRSRMATLVIASAVLLELMVSRAENVSSLLFGSITALTGTMGKPMGAFHLPPAATVGARPWTLISDADVHGPRLPASVRAVSRTNLADTAGKTASFSVRLFAHVPVATGAPQLVPSLLT